MNRNVVPIFLTRPFWTTSRTASANSLPIHTSRCRTFATTTTTTTTATIPPSPPTSSSPTNQSLPPIPNAVTRQDLCDEAAILTKSLYRTCLRSTKVIRWGNEFDEKEFERREEEFRQGSSRSGGGGGVLSMAPPPNKDDELRSRSEYYASYAREYFIQESDCLDNDPLQERDLKRYLYYLRKGEKDRRWLLGDMMFPDPYKHVASERQKRVERFEAMVQRYLGQDEEGQENEKAVEATMPPTDDGFLEDEDPEWFQKKYPHLR